MKPAVNAVILVLCCWFAVSCQQNTDPVIAKIGNQVITASEFKERLRNEHRNKELSDLSEAARLETMEKLLDDYRKVLRARELGLDDDPLFLHTRQRFYDRLVAVEYYQQQVVDKMVSEPLLRQYFEWQHLKIKAVSLRVGHQESSFVKKNRSREAALTLANQLAQEFRDAENPEEFANARTDDPKTRPLYDPYVSGVFGYEIDSMVYSAQPGEVVGPLDTDRGYTLFKILERVEIPRRTKFEEERENLVRLIRRTKTKEERQMFDQQSEALRTRYNVQIFDENIQTFFDRLKEWGARQDRLISDFTEEDRGLVFAETSGEPMTAGELIDFFQNRLLRDFQKFTTADDIKNGFVLPQVNLRVWALEGAAHGLQKRPGVQHDLKNFEINHLAKLLEDRQIDQQIEISDEEIQNYYQEHQEKYRVPEKMEIWAMAVENEQAAREAVRKLKAGVEFGTLVKQYGQNFKGQAPRTRLGFQTRNATVQQYQPAVDKAFELGPYQIAGPVMVGETPFVIKTGELQPSAMKPLDQVKGLIGSELYNRKRSDRQQKFLDGLKSRYSYRINESVLRRIS